MTDAAHPDQADPAPEGEEPKETSALQEWIEVGKTVFYALLIAMVLRIFLFQPFTIPSDSMEPNLLHGDYIIVSKWPYGYSKNSIPFEPPLFKGRILAAKPKRGDIIVFKLPSDNKTDYIKRLVGLPGDRIQVRDGIVYVNGERFAQSNDPKPNEKLDQGRRRLLETNAEGRSYATYDTTPYGDLDNTQTFLVPEGYYFFMGDNRDNSLDSRANVGFVPAENLVGKAEIILLSWNPEFPGQKGGASLFKPWTWFTEARPGRFFRGLK